LESKQGLATEDKFTVKTHNSITDVPLFPTLQGGKSKNKLKQVVHTLARFCLDVAENLLPLQEEGATTR
jgi:hypothetical protein